jgi:serine/threonine protein phosphatase PrpC
MVRCPHCGHDSGDRSFCDACNGVLPGSRVFPLPAVVTLPDGRALDCSAWQGSWPTDCWAPLSCTHDAQPFRLYALNHGWWRELALEVRRRQAISLDVLAPIHVIPVGDGVVVAAEALPGAKAALDAAPEGVETAPLDRLLAECRVLVTALEVLHEVGLVWLHFDPTALLTDGPRLSIANLDLQVFPAGTCPDCLRLAPAWSPPEVCQFRGERIGPPTDVFHLGMYAYYRLAKLLPGGFPGQGIQAIDFELPPLRVYSPALPPGIAPVIHQALARDPEARFATVSEFLAALECAVASAREGPASTAAVVLEVAGLSVVGRMHTLTGQPNQDDHRILEPGEHGLAVVVADGVSHARVGSGDLASRTACDTLAELLPGALARSETPEHLRAALVSCFLQASRAVLERALAEGPLPEGIDTCDLMSTTALVGVARGPALTLASAGDSRAYLVRDGVAEQLTVDGDVRCVQLARGIAPDEVRAQGADTGALYTCLGVGEPNEKGPAPLRTCVERATPSVTHWQLLPGDVVVLCTDGLVEENLFLSPSDLADLVEAAADLPAAELARHLVEAACLCHRDASDWEPQGCGDDVTCVLIKVSAAPGGAAKEP